MDTLQAMRGINNEAPQLTPLIAFELWQDTGSQQAKKMLSNISNGLLIKHNTDDDLLN